MRLAPQPRWLVHYVAVALVSLFVGLLCLREPGFGDELTYWSLAFDLHQEGLAGWSVHSFHDLRWPVWGVIWLWQELFGPGLASYYCTPWFYLIVSTSVAFTFGRCVLRSASGAWTCALALLFLPYLDPVLSRPMPDLSESAFGAGALLAWWAMMQAVTPRRTACFGVLSGLCVGLAFSNRITGVFIAPVLLIGTCMFFPRRWKWLFVPALSAAVFFVVECAIYFYVCGDWWHSIHANLDARGAKDIQVIAAWQLPLRYLPNFVHGNRLAPIYAALTALGLWVGWRRGGMGGRLIVVWFAVLYLESSCAVQSLHPVRPLLGSTVRYLAALALPTAILAGMGVMEAGRLLSRVQWAAGQRGLASIGRHPVLAGAASVALLALYSTRPIFDLGFTEPMRRRMASLPDGTSIFTHRVMRDVAFLADAADARRFHWIAPKAILERNDRLELQAASCDEFWYLRKQLWMSQRRALERKERTAQPALGSYFDQPERNWMLADVLAKGTDCDLVFYRRRPVDAPAPHLLNADAPEFRGLFPTLPVIWKSGRDRKSIAVKWKVPAGLRGKLLALEYNAASPVAEPLDVTLDFMSGTRRLEKFVLKPILHECGGKDFFALPIPKDGDVCNIGLSFSAKTSKAEIVGFRAVFDDGR